VSRLRRILAVVVATVGIALLTTSSAQAHSLESSTISVHVTDDAVSARISLAVATLDDALGTDYASAADAGSYSDAVTTYLADHLTVTAADGSTWGETWDAVTRTSVEGVDSLTTTVTFATGTSNTADFTIAYDAIIEAIASHEAVVVLTAADGSISTPGIITSAGDVVHIGANAADVTTGLADMVGYGFDHVLEGADHLLFLLTLLLPAPLIAVSRRWQRREQVRGTTKKLVAVITSFTAGHSLTLIASGLGWFAAPSRPVEVLIAVSVAVGAVHAIRPFARHGEEVIAAGFGLVHGLAFAGILTQLGLSGTTSVLDLLAFNVGVELAQLAVTALVFPSLLLITRTRFHAAFRCGTAGVALVAATAWALDRLGVFADPFTGVEDGVIAHLPWVAATTAALAAAAWAVDRGRRAAMVTAPS